jgi:cytochrome c oxidase subunit IV
MAAHVQNTTGEKQKPQTKELWKVFVILLVITLIEFIIAFTLGSDTPAGKWLKISIFIILTFVKSFYIVGTFMHLKDEVKGLIWTVILPIVFVLWFIAALVFYEGGYIGSVR